MPACYNYIPVYIAADIIDIGPILTLYSKAQQYD